jgi:hypothetical protein
MTTPLEREILTHYYVRPGEFPRSSEFIEDLHRKFFKAGLLEVNNDGDYVGNREALEVYMEALDAVPLPVRTWGIPK